MVKVLIFSIRDMTCKELSHPNICCSVKFAFLLQVFYECVYALHLSGYVNSLRAVCSTLVAVDAVVGLSQFGNRTVVTDEDCAARFAVVGILRGKGHSSFVDALVEVAEYSGNVKSIGTRHAIFAGGAGDSGVAQQLLCC